MLPKKVATTKHLLTMDGFSMELACEVLAYLQVAMIYKAAFWGRVVQPVKSRDRALVNMPGTNR